MVILAVTFRCHADIGGCPSAALSMGSLTHDDAAFWMGTPLSSTIERILTAQGMYGQGGQVLPFRWLLNLDEASSWPAAPIPVGVLTLGASGTQARPFRWGRVASDDLAYWVGRSYPILAVVGGKRLWSGPAISMGSNCSG